MPEIDLVSLIVINDVRSGHRAPPVRLSYRTDLHQKATIFRQDAILRRQLLHCAILTLPEHSRLGPMPQEGHSLMTGREIGMCRRQILHAPVTSGLHTFPVDEEHAPGLHRQRASGEVGQGLLIQMSASPGKNLTRALVKPTIVQETCNGSVVISENNIARAGTQGAQDVLRRRPMTRDISQANRHVHPVACEVSHQGFPGRTVTIDV